MNLDHIMPGFVWGTVTRSDDPDITGRVKCYIPSIAEPETDYWIVPLSWPGGGDTQQGPQYPAPTRGTQVAIIFEQGIYLGDSVRAGYLTGYTGLDKTTGASAGPVFPREAATAERARQRTVLWENEYFVIGVVDEEDDKRVVIQSLQRGTRIEIDAMTGTGGKSEKITLESATGIDIFAKGAINIESEAQVLIQGRRVSRISNGDI